MYFPGCKPTDVDAEFSLTNANNIDITNNLDDNHLLWSPQSGLWVLEGKVHLHAGTFTCKLQKRGVSPQIQRVFIKLQSSADTVLPSPR